MNEKGLVSDQINQLANRHNELVNIKRRKKYGSMLKSLSINRKEKKKT